MTVIEVIASLLGFSFIVSTTILTIQLARLIEGWINLTKEATPTIKDTKDLVKDIRTDYENTREKIITATTYATALTSIFKITTEIKNLFIKSKNNDKSQRDK